MRHKDLKSIETYFSTGFPHEVTVIKPCSDNRVDTKVGPGRAIKYTKSIMHYYISDMITFYVFTFLEKGLLHD